MRTALKVLPLAVLGCAAALLVACGDRNGLLSDSEASSLQDALAAAQSACAGGREASAELAAQRFADRVDALPPGSVDRRLIANLQRGAATLASLAADTCTSTSDTTTNTTPTVTTTTTPTTVPTTTTAPTTPTEPPTTPTEPPVTPTEPPVTTTTTPDNGGGAGSGGAGSGGAGSGGAGIPQGQTP